MNLAGDPVRRLLDEGEALLQASRGEQAALAFERVLLQDPGHADARRGLERAREAVREGERRGESHLDDAERALDAGDLAAARSHLEAALAAGGPGRPRALALADRLDQRSGRLSVLPSRDEGAGTPTTRIRGPHWSRRAFVATCGLVLAALTVGVAARWDDLLGRLTSAPRPSQVPAPPTLGPPAVSAAGRVVSDASPAGAR